MYSARPNRRAEAPGAAWRALLAALVLASAACSLQLAPHADAALAADLRAANRDAQVLLQQLREPSPGPCTTRRTHYSALIGQLRALAMQASARELPPASLLARLEGRVRADPGFSARPSARALHGAAATLEQMQQVDCAGKLHGPTLRAFTQQADLFLAQALAYETMLER